MEFLLGKTEEELIQLIDELSINQLKLPHKLRNRIKNGRWISPKDKTFLENLVIEKSPFKNDSKLIKGMINSFELYGLRLMNSESEGFKKWGRMGERIMFHGALEVGIHPGEIDPLKLILFADFGIGNDTPFGLDYRKDENNPSVVLLYYGPNSIKDNRWVEISANFDDFEQIIW